MKYLGEDLKKLPKLLLGFWILAFGLVLMKKAQLGLNAWGVFHEGLSIQTGISFGKIIQIVGIVLLVLCLLIKIYPGIGTLLNILIIGTFVDWIDLFMTIDVLDSWPLRITFFSIGLLFNTYGTALYIMCELGKGPRDGLFMGLSKVTGISIKYIRPMIEIVVLVIGFLFGGIVSVGTIIVALTSGYLVQHFFAFHKYDPKEAKQRKFRDYFERVTLRKKTV